MLQYVAPPSQVATFENAVTKALLATHKTIVIQTSGCFRNTWAVECIAMVLCATELPPVVVVISSLCLRMSMMSVEPA